MHSSFRRVGAMILRYLYLHKRSLPRTFEIVFWPVMELLVWGFVSVYIVRLGGEPMAGVATALLNAMVFWDILYRSQQGVSISFIEDIWTQNIVNLLVSPLRIGEWVAATFLYGLLKTMMITLVLAGIAWGLYRFNLAAEMQLYFVPLVFNLLLFGWALGIFTSALVIRWGHAAEALIWGVPFLMQPFSAIFYPLSAMPESVQPLCLMLPSTHVFEGMREVLATGRLSPQAFYSALCLNAAYFAAAGLFFAGMYRSARRSGRLGRLGLD
jgi:ABC-2 type transport system permease protein